MGATHSSPSTYSEWADLLDDFARGINDDGVIRAMHAGSIPWQSVVSERFVRRLMDAVNERMNRAVDVLTRDLGYAHGSDGEIARALLAARKEFITLLDALDTPVLPEDIKRQCQRLVVATADSVQGSLESSARGRNGFGRVSLEASTGRLASIVRNNAVNVLNW